MFDLIYINLVDGPGLFKRLILLAFLGLFLFILVTLCVSLKLIVILLVLSPLGEGRLSGVDLEGKVCDVRDRAYQALIIDDLLVLPPFVSHQWEHLLVMQLFESEEFVEVFHFIAYAELIITIFDMCEDYVHELAEDLLRLNTLLHAVAHEGHHDVEGVLVLDLQLDLLGLHFEQDHLLSMRLEYHPPE
jgi:hypothetical protein